MFAKLPFKFTIRVKLLLLSVLILGIPYAGFEYLRELESYLRDNLEIALLEAAKASAAPLHERSKLFPVHRDNPGDTLYLHEMNHPLQIDGYSEDWDAYIAWSDSYLQQATGAAAALSFRLIAGHYQQTYYVLLQVRDKTTVYQEATRPDSIDNDHVVLVLTDGKGVLRRYYFSPTGPGRIRPFTLATSTDEYEDEVQNAVYVTNISGEWQTDAEGYNLEVAIPASLVGERLGFVVVDSDGQKTRSLGTAGIATAAMPGRLLQSSGDIRAIVAGPGQLEGRRLWVLNNQGQVLTSIGSLDRQLAAEGRNILYSLVLPAVPTRVRDDLAGKSRLQGEEVRQALAGETGTRWRSAPDGKAVIVSAATPVWVKGEVRGVVVVEASSSGIQMLQRNAMASLFNKTLLVFVVVTGVLLLFATRLSSRIKRLSLQAAAAIDEHGRVSGDFQLDKSVDEIGDLSRNYAAMLDRLGEYNHYLENMAGRLSHEMRTPLAVVQSSLEQLQGCNAGEDGSQYLARAKQGVERLGLIISRLSEATRLELAMQSAEQQDTDIVRLLSTCCEGYRLAYPGQRFELRVHTGSLHACLAADLFVQMLDKLIANAVDFSREDSPVELELAEDKYSWWLSVTNYGPGLPPGMDEHLFNSMVSIRVDKSDRDPHLGLGLYIVRLIAEYCAGRVSACNLADGSGVRFTVTLQKQQHGDERHRPAGG